MASCPNVSLIQGGMGLLISMSHLAKSVSTFPGRQALGTVTLTAVDRYLAWILQAGDPSENYRKAFKAFPIPALASRMWKRYFYANDSKGFELLRLPKWSLEPDQELDELGIMAGFCEVFLAKQNHTCPIAVNMLHKVQNSMLPILFGAIIAGVDMVIMGAGIPKELPRVLNELSLCQPTYLTVDAHPSSQVKTFRKDFDSVRYLDGKKLDLNRPAFCAIISSDTLGRYLIRDPLTKPDGFVVEHYTAGGHSAPPRNKLSYGQLDEPDLTKILDFGLPTWLAGGYGHPEKLGEAKKLGFQGVQVGTNFAPCHESNLFDGLKEQIITLVKKDELVVDTTNVSSSGYPFKVVRLAHTLSETDVLNDRIRFCEHGQLTVPISDGKTVQYLCSAEPIGTYLKKGGEVDDTIGKGCLCCGLYATAGFNQVRPNGFVEPPIVTLGDDISGIKLLTQGKNHYSAHEVCKYILG